MSAINEAIEYKRSIERELQGALEAFTARSGLSVTDINLERIETTNLGDAHRVFGRYLVEVEVKL